MPINAAVNTEWKYREALRRRAAAATAEGGAAAAAGGGGGGSDDLTAAVLRDYGGEVIASPYALGAPSLLVTEPAPVEVVVAAAAAAPPSTTRVASFGEIAHM